MILNIYRIKPKSKDSIKGSVLSIMGKSFKYLFLALLLFFILNYFPVSLAFAITDPLSVPNNKFGIHLISASPEEITSATKLVNSNGGDWGYVTVLIENSTRQHDRWQKVFDSLREQHLIPIVRLATEPNGNYWRRPYDKEEEAWADFLDALVWPTKNRYVIIYNEPNQAHEWDGQVDPESYAKILDKTITALKAKSADFFILNAGFDASAPNKPPFFADELEFLKAMNNTVPGIFNKLDGWVSHSYPNPEFSAPPSQTGRGSIRTWVWELQQLDQLGVKKDLPVFITETGWKHAEGKFYDPRFPTADLVGEYFEQAFKEAWISSRVTAVTPFLLDYQEPPFDHFSFKKFQGTKQSNQVLASEYPEYYLAYQKILDLPKITGLPIQITQATLISGEIYPSLVSGQSYTIPLIFKNTGQSIWNDSQPVKLVPLQGVAQLGLNTLSIPEAIRVKPGEDYTFNLEFNAPLEGKITASFNLFIGDKEFSNPPIQFTTEIKSPVVLKIKTDLKWKNDPSGIYLLNIVGLTGEKITYILLGASGYSKDLENRYIPPDLTYNFTLKREFYKPKTIKQKVISGENILDFGQLEPDIPSAILNPNALWKLLPWSN